MWLSADSSSILLKEASGCHKDQKTVYSLLSNCILGVM